MIVDTSALVAILTGEPEGDDLLDRLVRAERPKISAATLLEASIVLDVRSAPEQRRRLDDLVAATNLEIIPFDIQQWTVARAAYQDFGRGSGHRARLNFGDCFAFALVRVTGEPLLFQGEDFAAAGVARA